jgi:hypothetical protein
MTSASISHVYESQVESWVADEVSNWYRLWISRRLLFTGHPENILGACRRIWWQFIVGLLEMTNLVSARRVMGGT